MKIKVLWNIRWNMSWPAKPGSGMEEATPERKTKEWNDSRIDLYERFCQPSLVAQTYGDFEVWLKCDPELKHLTESMSLADDRFSIVYVPDIHDKVKQKAAEWKEEGYDAILICRIDSDDCLHESALAEMVRATESMGDKIYVQLDEGLVYDVETKVLRDWNNPSPPFIGRLFPVSEIVENGFPPAYHHGKVRPQCKTICGRWYYLVVCHGANASNRISASWVGRELVGKEKEKALVGFEVRL